MRLPNELCASKILEAALIVAQAPVGASNQGGMSYPTQEAKNQASLKALSEVISKHGGSKEGLIAQYYRGTVEANMGNNSAAQSDLKAVANSSSQFASLAKVALAQIDADENRVADAQSHPARSRQKGQRPGFKGSGRNHAGANIAIY